MLWNKLTSISIFAFLLLAGTGVSAREPRLLLLVSVDQLRPDRLHADLPGGLGRLVRDGYSYTNASLDHGVTSTCPGHVALSTGVNPGKAGIPGNSYTDRASWQERYCVDDDDDRYAVLHGEGNRSPRNITVSTLGDWLKQRSPTSRVFAISGKDRAAITLGGHQADGVFWFSRAAGRFTTSGYYVDAPGSGLPDWVASFNGKDFFSDGFGRDFPATWEHPPGTLRRDDFPGEMQVRGNVSGHPINAGEARAEQIYYSPYIDLATLALAKQTVLAAKLGQGRATDMLAVSLSATDTVGHLYGPYSAESADALLKLDAAFGDFLNFLDEELGKGSYLLALSADHGVQPLPEWLAENDQLDCPIESGRVNVESFGFWFYWHIYWHFTLPFGDPMKLVSYTLGKITINERYAAERGIDVADVLAAIEEYVEGQPVVAEAWTSAELESSNDEMARLYRNSRTQGKTADLIVQYRENCLVWYYEGGTTHGSAYSYDRRVPIVFFGGGIEAGQSDKPARTLDVAPTLANLLNLEVPDEVEGYVLTIPVSVD